jgi:hypothetical protein
MIIRVELPSAETGPVPVYGNPERSAIAVETQLRG